MAAVPNSPRYTFFHLEQTVAALSRLRGMQSDVLKAAGFDDLLDQLEACSQSFRAIDEANQDMCALESGFNLLLELLRRDRDETVPCNGLEALMSPLVGRLAETGKKLNNFI